MNYPVNTPWKIRTTLLLISGPSGFSTGLSFFGLIKLDVNDGCLLYYWDKQSVNTLFYI